MRNSALSPKNTTQLDEPSRARTRTFLYGGIFCSRAVSNRLKVLFRFTHIFNVSNQVSNIYALLTKLVRSRWPDIGQILFLRFYGPRRTLGQYPAIPPSRHLDRTSLVDKGFMDKRLRQRISGTTRQIPSGQDRPISVAARVANQNTGFASSCPLTEPAI